MKMAECHPERKHQAKGLCHSCYVSAWTKANPTANTGAEWLRRNPEAAKLHKRKASLKKTSGATTDVFDALYEKQSGKCANSACGKWFPKDADDFRHALQVDHCHKTLAIRGLLCPRCNTALGHVDDDKEKLSGLIAYLNEFQN